MDGVVPLHGDHKPSFLVDPNKDLFYCYGCGRGGDVIRFAEIYHQVRFSQAVALLRQWRGVEPVLHEAERFYRIQLHRHSEAVAYLYQRGVRSLALIEQMRVGYAPGGCLRGWLTQLGHSLPALREAGLVTGVGYDAYVRRTTAHSMGPRAWGSLQRAAIAGSHPACMRVRPRPT
jgi:DNA primase